MKGRGDPWRNDELDWGKNILWHQKVGKCTKKKKKSTPMGLIKGHEDQMTKLEFLMTKLEQYRQQID